VEPVYKIDPWISTTPISITPLLRRRERRCLDLTPNPTSTELRAIQVIPSSVQQSAFVTWKEAVVVVFSLVSIEIVLSS
jgi:hypothetical protein